MTSNVLNNHRPPCRWEPFDLRNQGDRESRIDKGVSGWLSGSLILMVFCATLVFCWALAPGIAAAKRSGKIRAADTSSPRDTLKSFIDACNELYQHISDTPGYYDRADPEHIAISQRALDCIDDSELEAFARTDRAGQAAVCLKEILDRVELPPWEQIPDMEEIIAAGGLEKLTDYRIPDTRITISRVEQGSRRHEYLISPGTLERSCRYFASVASKPYRTDGPQVTKDFYHWYLSAPGHPALAAVVEKLPDNLQLGQTWGLANWKWPGLLLTVLVGLGLMAVVFRLHIALSKRLRNKGMFRYWLTLIFPILTMLIPLAIKYVVYRYLTIRGAPIYYINFACILAALLGALWIIFAASDRIAASIIASPHINPEGLNAQLIRIMAKLASGVAAVILFLMGGQYLGINLATLLASAGIGGVAVALSAQDTLKTLFGTLTLLADKPFRVGERIIFKQYDGVVEDIGIRSTSIRLLSGPQVTIPNDQLAGNDIQNVSRRPHIRQAGEIHIPLDTPYEKLGQAVEIIRDELQDHEGMDPDRPPRVFFHKFTPDSFCIQFRYWYMPPDRWKFKTFGDKLNFEIFRKFESEGIQFSLPVRHSFWKRDAEQGPLDIQVIDPPRKAFIRSRDDNEY